MYEGLVGVRLQGAAQKEFRGYANRIKTVRCSGRREVELQCERMNMSTRIRRGCSAREALQRSRAGRSRKKDLAAPHRLRGAGLIQPRRHAGERLSVDRLVSTGGIASLERQWRMLRHRRALGKLSVTASCLRG
jgi:hypothetical protein